MTRPLQQTPEAPIDLTRVGGLAERAVTRLLPTAAAPGMDFGAHLKSAESKAAAHQAPAPAPRRDDDDHDVADIDDPNDPHSAAYARRVAAEAAEAAADAAAQSAESMETSRLAMRNGVLATTPMDLRASAVPAEVKDTNAVNADVTTLDPAFRVKLDRVIERMEHEAGYKVTVLETTRGQDRQNALWEQGRTTPGPVVTWTRNSRHLTGDASDLKVTDQQGKERSAGYDALQRIAAEEGLHTLGAKDPGHLELRLAGRGTGQLSAAGVGQPASQSHPSPESPAGVVVGIAPVARVAAVAQVAQVARVAQVGAAGSHDARAGDGAPAVVTPARRAEALAMIDEMRSDDRQTSARQGLGLRTDMLPGMVAPQADLSVGAARMAALTSAMRGLAPAADAEGPTPWSAVAEAARGIGRARGAAGSAAVVAPSVAGSGLAGGQAGGLSRESAQAAAAGLPPAPGAAAAPGVAGSNAVRSSGDLGLARVMDVQDAIANRPAASSLTLRLDHAGGEDRVRLSMRDGALDATLQFADPAQADEATARLGELRAALARQGVAATRELTASAAATRLMAPQEAGRLEASAAASTQQGQPGDQPDEQAGRGGSGQRPDRRDGERRGSGNGSSARGRGGRP